MNETALALTATEQEAFEKLMKAQHAYFYCPDDPEWHDMRTAFAWGVEHAREAKEGP